MKNQFKLQKYISGGRVNLLEIEKENCKNVQENSKLTKEKVR